MKLLFFQGKYMKGGLGNRGFTLVELIVVITILAILGTIAFLSLQGYSGDARNTQRTSDLGNLQIAIEAKFAEGVSYASFADGTGAIVAGNNISISGRLGYDTLSGSYTAGDINYAALGIESTNFSDPINGEKYKYGATMYGNRYELAATVENGGGGPDSLIIGTWNPRNSTDNRGTRSQVVGKRFYLSGIQAIETGLMPGDQVQVGSTGGYIISKMENDIIYTTTDIATASSIFIDRNETRHLISSWKSNNMALDTGSGSDYIPYQIQ